MSEERSEASGYTRQSDEIETPLSATVSLKTASYLTPGGQLVVGVVRYVRGERKRALYFPVAQARAVADAIGKIAEREG